MSKNETIKDLPAFLAALDLGGKGNEQVSSADLAIPQLKVLQPLSPEVIREKKEAGTLYDTMSRECYSQMKVINLSYDFNVTIWKKRLKGGGRFGTYDTRKEAQEALKSLEGSADDYDVSDTGIHRLLMLDGSGEIRSPLIVFCSSTMKSFSDAWNTDIALALASKGLPRYAGIWSLGVETKTNTKGTWYAPTVKFDDYIRNEALFHKVAEQFEALALPKSMARLEAQQA